MWRYLLVLCCCVSCSTAYRYGYESHGADEFVIDSYKIQKGKFSILSMQGEPIGDMPEDAMEEYIDRIGGDDILALAIYHPTRDDITSYVAAISDSIGFRVQDDGTIVLPDVDESIVVAGLTLEEARLRLREVYQEHIDDVEVYLTYKHRLTKRVELAGLVYGTAIPVDGKIRLYEILATAKVPIEANLFMSYVIRDGTPLPIDLTRLLKHGDMSYNIVMKGGDKVYIADSSESRAMIMGEVGLPRAVNLSTGSMALREALVTAHGIPYTGDRRCIQVIRGNLLKPKIYTLSWNHIVHLPNDSLLLMPGDTVYVAAKPITEWNRFISQLVPSLSGIQEAKNTYGVLGI